MSEQEDRIVLLDEEGREYEFYVVDVIEVDGYEYAILLPTEEEVTGEAEVLRIDRDDEGKEILVQIDDEEEWERVAQAWEDYVDELYEMDELDEEDEEH
ncbi:MAG TPA: DUF1292 domain-containing protein [Firmicutes bacterium]|nr:DUF1292 domain-containing protein [Bacillota bacterium]